MFVSDMAYYFRHLEKHTGFLYYRSIFSLHTA